MVDIASALISIKTIAGIAKDAGKIEITQHVISLQQTMMALQGEGAELAEQNRDLKTKIRELLDQLRMGDEFYFERNAYWRGEDAEREGPFCSRCLDADGKAVRLTQNAPGHGYCHNCKSGVLLESSDERRERTVRPRPPGWVNSWRE
jgi:hypothetical protein